MIFSTGFLGSLLDVVIPSSIFLAAIAVILVVTSQLLSSSYGRVNVVINKKRLRNATIGAVIAFIITMTMIIFIMIMEPETLKRHIGYLSLFSIFYYWI